MWRRAAGGGAHCLALPASQAELRSSGIRTRLRYPSEVLQGRLYLGTEARGCLAAPSFCCPSHP